MSQQIDLIKFLFLSDTETSQAEYILQNFSNFSLPTLGDFYGYFQNLGIVLKKEPQKTTNQRLNLLEKFKSLKPTFEYEVLKKFIEEQKNASLLLGTRDAQAIEVAINSIEKYDLDVFDYYIVRKILTGSESGVLPSEELKTLLEQLIYVNNDIFAEDAGIERDDYSKIKSYQNIYRNKGRIQIPILDDRFTTERFNYIIQRGFETLPDAVSSERNILRKIQGMSSPLELDMFLSDISNLINQDENSIPGLEAKIARLEEIIQAKQELIESMVDAEIEHEAYIDAIAIDNILKEQQIEDKDQSIQNLQQTVDSTLVAIQNNVSSQINTVTAAIDTLSQTVVDQANAANAAQDESVRIRIEALSNELAELKKQLAILSGPSPKAGTCFSSWTKISTPNGLVQIKDIKLGDTVYAFDYYGNKVESEVIHFTHHTEEEKSEVFRYMFSNNFTLDVTDNHGVLNEKNEFVSIGSLQFGESLLLENGELAQILSKEFIGVQEVYNISTKNYGTYFANGVCVSGNWTPSNHLRL